MTDSSKFYFKTEKNDLNEKTDGKMSKENDVNQNLQIVNKSHAKTKNNKKQIMKNDFNKKKIFVYEIHEWLNCALNDLWKSINIFDASPNQRFEKIENEMTRWINENEKQSDHTNVDWKDWICEISVCLQDFEIWLFILFLRSE